MEAVTGSLSSRGTIGGRWTILFKFSAILAALSGFRSRNEDGFICWSSIDNGNLWRGSGVHGVGGEIVDGQLGTGVGSG